MNDTNSPPVAPPQKAADHSSSEPLIMHVLYERPLDYPNHVVIRTWYVRENAIPSVRTLHASIADARASLPPGLTRLPRDPSDEPQIVESWI
jgi:hypothetical protein